MSADAVLTQAIDPGSDRPVYKQIADHLREAIARRRLPEGEQLPSEAQLMEHYGVAGSLEQTPRSSASSPACSSRHGLLSSSRCWIRLARRACEICQSKKTSVIGSSSHCTVHPEIMSGDMDSGQVTFLSRGRLELLWLV